jgi:precorrin-2 dehydrogenase/sirohydrochlorin ferrochelatase
MIPVYVDPAAVRVAVVGRGALAVRRISWLRAAGAKPDVWSDRPSADLAAAAPNLHRQLPSTAAIQVYAAIWVADLDSVEAERLARMARDARVLVNVEDVVSLCDFHTPAVVRRGRLTLTAGTGGASPAVARAARERLEAVFSEAWAGAIDEIAEARSDLRARGAGGDALAADARTRLARHGLG